jgi:hypothetical protein
VELKNGEGDGGCDVRKGLESPGMGVVEEEPEFCPAGGDIGGGEGMDIMVKSGLTAAVDRVDLPETGYFSFLAGIEGRYGNAAFQGTKGCGETFSLEPEGSFVFFEVPVYGRGAYGFEFSRDFGGDVEGWPSGDILYLLAHEGGEDFATFVPEKGPEDFEDSDDLVGVDSFPYAVCGPLFF